MMTREEFCILNSLYEDSDGRAGSTADLFLNQALRNKAARTSLYCEVSRDYIQCQKNFITK